MSTPLTIEQLTEDQAHLAAEHLAMQFLMGNLLKAMDLALVFGVLKRTKGELELAQGMATTANGSGYVEGAILMIEQIEANVMGTSRGPSRGDKVNTGVPFDFSPRGKPPSEAA